MAPKSTSSGTPGFPIGVVSRLTGIHPETLRMWERRYGLVSPERSPDGNRLYSQQDVRRLMLVKALTDAGHPVGSVALLPVDALESLLDASGAPAGSAGPAAPDAPCHVAVVGAGLSARVAHEAAAMPLLEVVGTYGRIEDLGREAPAQAPDVIVLELPTVQAETVADVRQRLASVGARGAVVAFGFGATRALEALESAGVICLQAPIAMPELQRACLEAVAPGRRTRAIGGAGPQASAPRYSAEQLARIAVNAPRLACECPRHLVDLVSSLNAFETYSRECAQRSPADAELHQFLNTTTAAARALLEEALQRVIEFEGITLA
jgi:hypothetical protein